MKIFLHSLQSEWLKKRGSAASWLVVIGGFLIPAIMLLIGFFKYESLKQSFDNENIWLKLFYQNWQFMSILVLPLGIILVTSLIAQIEYRNNTWKQLHTSPQPLTTIFIAKFTVIILMLLQFFVLFNLGIYLLVAIPPLVYSEIDYPSEPYPFWEFMLANGKFFLFCLPIVAFQYLLSLQFKNFMVPIGIGLAMYISAQFALSWSHGYVHPFTYCPSVVLSNDNQMDSGANLYLWSMGYFTLLTLASYILYVTKKAKG